MPSAWQRASVRTRGASLSVSVCSIISSPGPALAFDAASLVSPRSLLLWGGVALAVVGVVAALVVRKRCPEKPAGRPKPAGKLRKAQRTALARVSDATAAFDLAVERTTANVTTYSSDLITKALDAYDTIKSKIGTATGTQAAAAMDGYRAEFDTLLRDRATKLGVAALSVNRIVEPLMSAYDAVSRTIGAASNPASEIDDSKARFDAAVRKALADSAGYSQKLVDEVHTKLKAIEADLKAAESESIASLQEQAEGQALMRAYVLAPPAIAQEVRARLVEMREWAVPPSIIDDLEKNVLPAVGNPDVNVAREGLHALLEAYERWSWYVDQYDEKMGTRAKWLVAGVVATLLGALAMLWLRWVIPALLLAGGSGALVSILAKLPPLLAYGEAKLQSRGIARRFGAGFAGSAIGCGLLAAGVFSINLPENGTFQEIMGRCGRCERVLPGSTTVTPSGGNDAGAKDAAIGTVATSGARPRDGAAQSADESDPPTDGKPKPDGTQAGTRPTCSPANQLLLIAVAMLLGFSERALTSFEEQILSTPAKPATPPAK